MTHLPENIVLFDGYCNLCDGAVRFIIDHDRAGRIRFASLQSEPGQALLEGFGHAAAAPESIVLVDGDRLYERSDATLRIAALLDAPWSAARVLLAVPRPLRDSVYRFVARNRYRIFGKRDACRIPTPSESARFL